MTNEGKIISASFGYNPLSEDDKCAIDDVFILIKMNKGFSVFRSDVRVTYLDDACESARIQGEHRNDPLPT